jgi:hypothetical protein
VVDVSARVEEVKKELFKLWDRVREEVLAHEIEYPEVFDLVVKYNGEEVDRIAETCLIAKLPNDHGFIIFDTENPLEVEYGGTLREVYMSYLRRLIAQQGEHIGYILAREGNYSEEWFRDELQGLQKILEELLTLYTLAKENKLQFELKEVE